MKMIFVITVFLCFLMDLILVGLNFFSILGCLGMAAVCILWFLGKRDRKIFVLGIIIAVVGLLGSCFRERESYIQTYRSEIERANVYLEKEKTEEALALLDELELNYGKREETVMIRMICHLVDGDYDKALAVAKDYPNRTTQEYYSVMEDIYKELEESGEENLNVLYLEAAEKYPNWLHMQLSAGMVQLKQKQYNSAKNYFERAYYLDYENGMAPYLLGLTSYYMGDYRNCLFYYNEALEKGVSDEIKEAILNQVTIVREDE